MAEALNIHMIILQPLEASEINGIELGEQIANRVLSLGLLFPQIDECLTAFTRVIDHRVDAPVNIDNLGELTSKPGPECHCQMAICDHAAVEWVPRVGDHVTCTHAAEWLTAGAPYAVESIDDRGFLKMKGTDGLWSRDRFRFVWRDYP